MDDSAEDFVKKLSNPISTGGGGTNFEYNVQSLFVVLMLTRGVAPCLPAWPIVEIKLQGKYDGYETDDFIAFAQEPNTERRAKLLAQIKRDIRVTAGDDKFADVIKAMWADFGLADFNRTLDSIALITGPISSTDCTGVRSLLHFARTSASSSEFHKKMGTSSFASDLQREKLQVFRGHLMAANDGNDVTEEELWQFLCRFHLVGYDLEFPYGSALSLLASLVMPYGHSDVEGLLNTIKNAVSWHDQAAGTMNSATLPLRISELFQEKVVEEIIPVEFAPPPSHSGPIEIPDDTTAEALKFAAMLGSWNENVPGDKEIIVELISTK